MLSDNLDQPFYFSQFEYKERKICIVKIVTEDGYEGWGEGYGPGGLVKAGIEYLSNIVINKEALNHEQIWMDMYRLSYDYARKGVLLSALSAIDIALWDLKGKILNQPVSTLLGGRLREKVSVYASGLYFTHGKGQVDKLAREALSLKGEGYKAIKMKVGLGIEKDTEHIRAVRESLGNEIDLMVDANHAYCLEEAKKFLPILSEYNIRWFEEPVPNEDHNAYQQLRNTGTIAIAGGECEYLKYGAMEFLSHQCVDIFQPDTCACGGITELKKMLAISETFFINVTPHNWGTGIAVATNLHIISTIHTLPQRLIPSEPILEMDCSPNRLRNEIITNDFKPENGILQVPDGPGLGIEIDIDMIEKFKSE
ncbi:MAG: mandelate racemase/muconate lactonizing enzyme family protein [Bacteroidales bacterium]